MSRACGNETDGVCMTQKETNENQNTCKCTDFLSMKSDFYTGSTRLHFIFFSDVHTPHNSKVTKKNKNAYVHLMKTTNAMQILR